MLGFKEPEGTFWQRTRNGTQTWYDWGHLAGFAVVTVATFGIGEAANIASKAGGATSSFLSREAAGVSEQLVNNAIKGGNNVIKANFSKGGEIVGSIEKIGTGTGNSYTSYTTYTQNSGNAGSKVSIFNHIGSGSSPTAEIVRANAANGNSITIRAQLTNLLREWLESIKWPWQK